MKKYRGRIIAAAMIAAVLVFVYWWGGNSPALHGWRVQENRVESTVKNDKPQNNKIKQTEKNEDKAENTETFEGEEKKQEKTVLPENGATPENRPQKPDNTPMTAEEKIAESGTTAASNTQVYQEGSVTYSDRNGLKMSGEGNNEAQTAPTVSEECKEEVQSEEEHICTLSVRCDSILSNIAWLDPAKVGLVPSDGVIFAEKTVTFYEGESVFNLLLREMKKNKIHMEFENTPLYNSAYVEDIANLYEFDCGELSGWMYSGRNQYFVV